MIPLVLLGAQNDHKISSAFFSAISGHFSAGMLPENFVGVPSGKEDFLLFDSLPSVPIYCPGGIVILKNQFPYCSCCHPPQASVCIVPSQNPNALSFAANSGIPSIACGASTFDSLTFSSFTPERAVISIQRKLFTLTGSDIEPAEFPIKLSGNPNLYTVLAVAGIFLISGYSDILQYITISD